MIIDFIRVALFFSVYTLTETYLMIYYRYFEDFEKKIPREEMQALEVWIYIFKKH